MRYYYETTVWTEDIVVIADDGKVIEDETETDGFAVYDRVLGSSAFYAFCTDRDAAERIVNALNLLDAV